MSFANEILDVLHIKKKSQAGEVLGFWGRIFYHFNIVSDDPDLVRAHDEQDMREEKL